VALPGVVMALTELLVTGKLVEVVVPVTTALPCASTATAWTRSSALPPRKVAYSTHGSMTSARVLS